MSPTMTRPTHARMATTLKSLAKVLKKRKLLLTTHHLSLKKVLQLLKLKKSKLSSKKLALA